MFEAMVPSAREKRRNEDEMKVELLEVFASKDPLDVERLSFFSRKYLFLHYDRSMIINESIGIS